MLTAEIAQIQDPNTPASFRQTNLLGSQVDVNVISGPNPDFYSAEQFDSIEAELEDPSFITTLLNSPSSGLGDATHAFQWNLTLATGASQTIELDKVGNFASIVLPFQDANSVFVYDNVGDLIEIPVDGLPPAWFDPQVAVGYEYQITNGDNAYAELYLPTGFTDDNYVLEILDPNHSEFGTMIPITGADNAVVAYDFVATDTDGDPNGVSHFRITGIEPAALIDPNESLAFPTGFTFVNANNFSMTQSPIVVPEPSAIIIMALGLLGLATLARRV